MDEYINYVHVRSIVLAQGICISSLLIVYLTYSLLYVFADIFAISIVTSLAIRPLKEKIYEKFLIYLESTSSVPLTSNSLLAKIKRKDFNIFELNPYTVLFALSCAVLVCSLSIVSLILLLSILTILDYIFRFFGDIILKILRLFKLSEPKETFNIMFTVLLIVVLITLVLLLQFFVISSIVIELSTHGNVFYAWLSNYLNTESLENLKNTLQSQFLDNNLREMLPDLLQELSIESGECSVYIEKTENLPLIRNMIFDRLVLIDDWLAHFDFSLHQLLNLYFLNPEKFHEIVLKIIFMWFKLFLGNIGGVAVAISTTIERVILYLTLVYLLVKDNTSIIERALNMVPVEKSIRFDIFSDIILTISGVTLSFLLTAVSHYMINLLSFFALDLELKYTFAALSALVGLFPFFGAWFVNMPMIIWLTLWRYDYRGIVLFIIEYFLVGYLDAYIYSAYLKSFNPTLIGIVATLGIYKFGAFGIFYGPIILSLGYMIFKLGKELNKF